MSDDLPRVAAELQRLLLNPPSSATGSEVSVHRERFANARNRLMQNRGEAPVPDFLFEITSWDKAWSYVTYNGRTPERRAEFVNTLFDNFWRWVEGSLIDERPVDLRPTDPVRTSAWHGRRSIHEVARLVLAVGPVALEGVHRLLEEHERRIDNSPPEPIDAQVIKELRELHCALGELISLSETQPLAIAAAFKRMEKLGRQLFSATGHAGRLLSSGAAPTASTILLTWGTVKALEVMTGSSIDGEGIGAIAGGVGVITAHVLAGEQSTKPTRFHLQGPGSARHLRKP